MDFLRRAWAIGVVTVKRLITQPGLALATLVGLVVAVALALCIPLYADAVYYRVLWQELARGTGANPQAQRPAFAFMFRHVGAWNGPITLAALQPADDYLRREAAPLLGLPQVRQVRFLETDTFRLFPSGQTMYSSLEKPLAWVSFGTATDLASQITLLEGSFPADAPASPGGAVDVLVSEARATELGLQVGETYVAFSESGGGSGQTAQIAARIAGVWRAADPQADYWFYQPAALNDILIVSEAAYVGQVLPPLGGLNHLALWYLVLDGSRFHAGDVPDLLGRITVVRQRVSELLPDIRLDVSPDDALRRYQSSANLLTFRLYAFSVPILGLILAFIGLVSGLSIGRRRSEIAVLRSRGATSFQIVGMALLEGALLGLVALLVAAPLSEWIAVTIGRARSFLDFALPSSLRVDMSAQTWRAGLAAVAVAIIAQVMPTVRAAQDTIVSYKQERARSARPPWWQRTGLDLLLLVPTGYGAYLLQQQGSLAVPGAAVAGDPFQNPLLFIVPSLGIFALTLVLLRILPWLMSALAWLAGQLNNVGILLASRHLSRSIGFYAAPLVLLVTTLSLSAFTASLAQTLDEHLYDQSYYRAGADMTLVEVGESPLMAVPSVGGPAVPAATPAPDEELPGPLWTFPPVSEHLRARDVRAAGRYARFDAVTNLSGERQAAVFIGIDRIDFPHVAYWRRDFAPASLGALMNALAVSPEGILMPGDLMRAHALDVGDTFRLTVRVYGKPVVMDVKVVGEFRLFPTWYPETDGPLFVGNLDHLFEQAGGLYPYDVWLRTEPGAQAEPILSDLQQASIRAIAWDMPADDVVAQQQRPERQGLFGVLSVGFLAAALVTVLGFFLYALFSFRRRFIELGILRAIGLSAWQLTVFLAWELAFLILTGVAAGTFLGTWASALFIPYLQIGTTPAERIPPFWVAIAWPAIVRIYVLFGLLFLAALGLLAALLLRMRLFQAIKLGETQ